MLIEKLLILKNKIRELFKLEYIKLNVLKIKVSVLFIKKFKRVLQFYYNYCVLNIIIISNQTLFSLIIKTFYCFIKNK